MKILLGHTFSANGAFGASWIEAWLARLRRAGIEVDAFSLVMDQEKSSMVYYPELNYLWQYRDRDLLAMYDRLIRTLEQYDVFISYGGANLHPDFVAKLDCFTAYSCFDDPESSHKLSKPVVQAFDMALVGNIAAVQMYKSWGVKEAIWWPLGFRHDDYDSALGASDILNGERNVDITLLCERVARYRRRRVDKFAATFPDGAYFGRGWPAGFLPEIGKVPLLQKTRIGINIHNSTGPINFRTFVLPANGVLQICDNKSHLGDIFTLGKEAVGFDTISEAIELSRYYLEHEEERRQIAAAGWARATRDYNEVASFRRAVEAIQKVQNKGVSRDLSNFPSTSIRFNASGVEKTVARSRLKVKHLKDAALYRLKNM